VFSRSTQIDSLLYSHIDESMLFIDQLSKVFLSLLLIFMISLQVYADGKPVINEFFPPPGSGDKEWVELYVPDGSNLNGYWIDDDTDFLNDTGVVKKRNYIN
jgi:hypothetical protein